MSITLQQFIQKYNGTNQDFDGGWSGQCVDLARMWAEEGWGIKTNVVYPANPNIGGAVHAYTDYPNSLINGNTKIQRIENSVNNFPVSGDIIIWNRNKGGGFGHIAVIKEADINSFTVVEQNNGNGDGYGKDDAIKITKYPDYTDVLGWLNNPEEDVEPPQNLNLEGLNDAEKSAILALDMVTVANTFRDRHDELKIRKSFHIQSEEDMNEWVKNWGVARLKELGIRTYTKEEYDELWASGHEAWGIIDQNKVDYKILQDNYNKLNSNISEQSVTEVVNTPNIANTEVKNPEKFSLNKFFIGITKDGTFYATTGSLLTGLTTLFPDNQNVTGFVGTVTLLISGLKALTNLGSKLNK
jgi:CHAP domain